MERTALLEELIEVIDPIDEITEDTVISESDDLDSLALFNIVIYLKSNGMSASLNDLAKCKTISDLLDLALSKK
ncbi:MAG: phosphopantetheine-binding protein [Succinivibrio sp.]